MRCTSCHHELELAHVWVGSKTICPYCHAVLLVPDVAATKPPSANPLAWAIVRVLMVLLLLVVCGFLVWAWMF